MKQFDLDKNLIILSKLKNLINIFKQVKEKISEDATLFLKGIAIISVLINHYANSYTNLDIGFYANGMMALFFVLSGFGIYYSLEKRFRNQSYSLKTIAKYHPDVAVSFLTKQLKAKKQLSKLMLKKAFTYLSEEQKLKIQKIDRQK